MLDNPRLCGRVRFRGEVLPGVMGQWETILSEEEFDAVQVAVAARRKINDRWTNDRRHLLSGALLRCGVEGCGRKIHAFKQTSGVWAYRCPGHLSRDLRSVDAHVIREVAAYALDNPIRVAEWHRPEQQDLSEQIGVLERRKADAVAAFAEHGGDPAALAMLTADLQARIESLRDQQVDQIAFETGIDWAQFDLTRILAEPASDPAGIDQQRAAIVLFVESITLRPGEAEGSGLRRVRHPDSVPEPEPPHLAGPPSRSRQRANR